MTQEKTIQKEYPDYKEIVKNNEINKNNFNEFLENKRDCAKEHNIKHCYECEKFPCKRLEEFSKTPIINGICNHSNVIPDLESLKKIGKAEWIKKKIEEHTCKKCRELISWFDINSHKCK